MIYKFIDNNGSEITVNSLSSLQALVDSETVKKETKVKAGLRGKWTTASKIDGLIFEEEEVQKEEEKTEAPKGDIKDFITGANKEAENSKEFERPKEPEIEKPQDQTAEQTRETSAIQPQDLIPETPQESINEVNTDTNQIDESSNTNINEVMDEDNNYQNNTENEIDNSDYYTEKFNKENELKGLNFADAVKICFKKYFDFKGRASRSEYWFFTLFIALGYFVGIGLIFVHEQLFWLLMIFVVIIIIPWISVAARRLHDINKSGWFQLIPLPAGILEFIFAENRQESLEIFFLIVGLLCYLYLVVLLCTASIDENNRFGKNPLKPKN